MSIKQPCGNIKQKNVSFIKYKFENKHFEIACYKNKIINWRNGVEKNLSEVLQTEQIYLDGQKGTVANSIDLQIYFPDMQKLDIIKLILEKGKQQMGKEEKDLQYSNLHKDMCNIIKEKCVHPDSKRQFSLDSILKAFQDIGFTVKSDKTAKQQALVCIKELQKKYYIARAEMKIKFIFNLDYSEILQQELFNMGININEKNFFNQNENEFICLIQPCKYRPLTELIKNNLNQIVLEVIETNIQDTQVQQIQDAGTVELRLLFQDDLKNQIQLQQQQNQIEMEEDEENKNQNNKKKNKGKNTHAKKNSEYQPLLASKQNQKQNQKIQDDEKYFYREEEKQQLKQINDSVQITQCQRICTTCDGIILNNKEDFKTHFKSEYHNVNVRRKVQGLASLSEQQYINLLKDK